jgi:hypothetical protein
MNTPDTNNVDIQKRKFWRKFFLFWCFGVALIFIFFFKHLAYAGIPVSYLGYFLIILGVLGLLGVNVWIGGPLDKRFDKDQHQ